MAEALLQGRPYFGRALRALQGDPARHQYFLPVLRVLAASLARPLEILEVGSWAGASAVTWAKALQEAGRGGTVMCVDTWSPYFDLTRETGRNYAEMDEAGRTGDAFRLFVHNIRSSGVEGMIRHRIGDSREVLGTFQPGSSDLVYLDGSHVFEVVQSDIGHARRLLRPGGILCGDDLELQQAEVDPKEHGAGVTSGLDYILSSTAGRYYHPGVTEAVAVELGEVSAWNGFWAVRKREHGWQTIDLDLQDACLPKHIEAELEAERLEVVGETSVFNLVRCGTGHYVALAKSLGPLEPLVERLGERDLGSLVLMGRSLDEVRAKIGRTAADAAQP
ncbi:MAG: class I SAM-dependent methyltransferase, partial [Actinomycetota bacterium]